MYEMWRNKKNQEMYVLLSKSVINATNSANNEVMYLYRKASDHKTEQLFVRLEQEFLEKFEPVLTEKTFREVGNL